MVPRLKNCTASSLALASFFICSILFVQQWDTKFPTGVTAARGSSQTTNSECYCTTWVAWTITDRLKLREPWHSSKEERVKASHTTVLYETQSTQNTWQKMYWQSTAARGSKVVRQPTQSVFALHELREPLLEWQIMTIHDLASVPGCILETKLSLIEIVCLLCVTPYMQLFPHCTFISRNWFERTKVSLWWGTCFSNTNHFPRILC